MNNLELVKNVPSGRDSYTHDYHRTDNALNKFMDEFTKINGHQKVLYIHIPYCVSKCKYCKWQSSIGETTDVNQHCLITLSDQINKVMDVFGDIKFFHEVYFGGGTPTMASYSVLEKLFKRIPNFMKIQNKCIEASPDTLTVDHVKLFKEYNFDFISVGIQTLNPLIAYKQNRPYISHQECIDLAHYLVHHGFYTNFDMICFLNYGDIRDIPQFGRDLDFLMNEARPTSITIHQQHYAFQSIEKTTKLIELIKDKITGSGRFSFNQSWRCVNTVLDVNNAEMDAMYRAEYKIARSNYSYMHHLWDKYNLNLKNQYDVLALGSTPNHPIKSFCNEMIYDWNSDSMIEGPFYEYPPQMFNQLYNFRRLMNYE